MQQQDGYTSGWDFVASSEAAASLIEVALELDPEETVTRSELTGMADVTLKRLYLDETITELVEAGVFEPVDDADGQAQYVVNDDSDVFAAAEQFDRTLAKRLAD